MPATPVRLDIKEDVLVEIATLSEMAGSLSRILDAASEIPPQVGTTALSRQIAERVGIGKANLRIVLVALLNLYHTQLKLKIGSIETVEAITENLGRLAKSKEDQDRLTSWKAVKTEITEALGRLTPDHPLEASYKAYRVATARQTELVDMKKLTDARPVCNEAGDTVIQTIITHDGVNDSVYEIERERIKNKFLRLRDIWKAERGPTSSTQKMVMHPAYQTIIGMGLEVVPFLLEELQSNLDSWFWALRAITEENPVPREAVGDGQAMAQAWLKWGREEGYSR